MSVRAAFTLLEALIALAIGVAICAAGWSAVRACAQTAAAAQRLSVENRLLRAGIGTALDELDAWTLIDDPRRPDRQPLRAPGHPFAPLAFASPTPLADDQSAPRAWWRGLGASSTATTWGDYALFSRAGWTAPWADAATAADRRWYADALATVHRQLGCYALLDYLPANAIDSYYDEDHAVPQAFRSGGTLYLDGGSHDRPQGFGMLVHNVGFAVSIDPGYLAMDVDHRGFLAWGASPFSQDDVLGRAPAVDATPLPLAPAAWPALALRFKRYVFHQQRFLARAEITLTSPLTGRSLALALMPTATTLRGARRARGLDPVEP